MTGPDAFLTRGKQGLFWRRILVWAAAVPTCRCSEPCEAVCIGYRSTAVRDVDNKGSIAAGEFGFLSAYAFSRGPAALTSKKRDRA